MSHDRPKSQDCSTPDCCTGISRRRFLAASTAAAAVPVVAGPFTQQVLAAEGEISHLVPVDKKLSPEWVKSLTARGQVKVWTGDELNTLGMPVGGVGAGEMYLCGDGRLAVWHIHNYDSPMSRNNQGYQASQMPGIELNQGFALRVKPSGGAEIVRTLDKKGFPNVGFIGRYPIGKVLYRDDSLPVEVEMEGFSPFIPLNAKDSALPATIMEFHIKNRSGTRVEVSLAGWLESPVGVRSSSAGSAGRRQQMVQRGGGVTGVHYAGLAPEKKDETQPEREPVVFADFEGKDYNGWTVNGEALGSAPAKGAWPGQNTVSGHQGKGLINTYRNGDDSTGKAVSPEFTIERPYINFLIGGGSNDKKTYIRLLVGGREVHRAAGRDDEALAWKSWNVSRFKGKKAKLEVVDDATGGWGHINIDQITFADRPATSGGEFAKQNDFGTFAFSVLGEDAAASADVGMDPVPADLFGRGLFSRAKKESTYDLAENHVAALGKTVQLEAGESATVTFVLAWHFPHRRWGFPQFDDVGNYYATLFNDAGAVVDYIAKNYDRLAGDTRLYCKTYYDDSNLPHWLLERIGQTPSILASGTVHWRANGRFWGWEGVGCCAGTCTHVWNYEHALARLFPELERSMREMQDYDAGFAGNGLVSFRADSYVTPLYAADGQAGTVLKSYREHLCNPDGSFLKRNYQTIKAILGYSMLRDRQGGRLDGVITDEQHNTYDINYYGANTMVGSLYLAALLAGEKMAQLMGDEAFATECRELFEKGSKWTVENIFDGEYFYQIVPEDQQSAEWQYEHGCLADQLFGQGWAHQLDLGYVYPKDTVKAALAAIWKYDWAPDIGPQNAENRPRRWFARNGDAGLFICTWPKTPRPGYRREVVYRNEVWTGIEYQVAGNMLYDGMITEGLGIIRGIHDRHEGVKHNPYNEVECGDHYARAMAGWGCLLAASGFHYDGPAGTMDFAPKFNEKDFSCFFSGAEGWGLFQQKEEGGKRVVTIDVRHGKLALSQLRLDGAGVRADGVATSLNGRPGQTQVSEKDGMIVLSGPEAVTFPAGSKMRIELPLA